MGAVPWGTGPGVAEAALWLRKGPLLSSGKALVHCGQLRASTASLLVPTAPRSESGTGPDVCLRLVQPGDLAVALCPPPRTTENYSRTLTSHVYRTDQRERVMWHLI